MGLDFSAFLLNYMERLFLKRFDIVNLLIAIVAVIVSLSSLIVASNTIVPPDYKITINLICPLIVLGVFIYVLFYIPQKRSKNNDCILEIERAIILNYDYINDRDETGKNNILNQIKLVSANKFRENDVVALINLLSRSPSDTPQATKRSWCDWFWNGGERYSQNHD